MRREEEVLVSVPGACGEIVQGTLDGIPCLVSCPIDLMNLLRLTVKPGTGRISAPDRMTKTRSALQLAMDRWKAEAVDISLERMRELPESRGFASSTADILGALYGLCQLTGRRWDPEEATRIAIQVEPTDSIAWPELALLAHRDGSRMKVWGSVPPLNMLVLDWGEEIDTVEFNRRLHPREDLETRTREAFELLREAVRRQNPDLLGRAATMSALANQHLLYKSRLQDVLHWAVETDALGVCVAHSGGLIGVLLRDGRIERQQEYLLKRLSDNSRRLEHRLHRLIPAGPRVATSGQTVTAQC